MATNELPYVVEGETYPRTVSVDKDASTVTRAHVTRHKSGDMHLTWTFDFSDVSESDLLELASRSVLIAYRNQFRNVDTSSIKAEWVNKTVDVQEFLSRERTRVAQTPAEKLASAVKKLTPEEIAEILKAQGVEIK